MELSLACTQLVYDAPLRHRLPLLSGYGRQLRRARRGVGMDLLADRA